MKTTTVKKPDGQEAAAGEPLVLLAAAGTVPYEVARAATASGRKLLVIALDGEYDPRLAEFPLSVVKWGQVGRILTLMADQGARDLVLIGAVNKRPDFSSIGVDLGTFRHLPRLLKMVVGGDDTVMGNVVRFFEERGSRVVGAHEIAPELVAPPGLVAGGKVPEDAAADAAVAMAAARAIGAIDAGQAAVAVGSRVVALEAAEGTDAMLERVASLRANRRVEWSGRSGVLAKRSKPQQDLRVDMPVIGPRTVEAVARAGLAGIAIEAYRVMIADRAETVAAAGKNGIFILADPNPPMAAPPP